LPLLLVAAVVGGCSGSAGPPGAAGPQGKQGRQGPPGTSPNPQSPGISGVEPYLAYLARSGELTISGYATKWSEATAVDLGAGITVTSLQAPSPMALIVKYTIDPTALTGPRDVNVMDVSGGPLLYLAGIDVEPPMTATVEGNASQGSLAFLYVQLTDTSIQLDTTSATDASGTVVYPNLAITLPAGVHLSSWASVLDYSARALLTFDVDAPSTTSDLDLVSGPAGSTSDTHFPVPLGISVGPRTATALTDGKATAGSTFMPFDSGLYSFTQGMAKISILDFAATSTVNGSQPGFALLPKSGHFKDLIGIGPAETVVSSFTDPFYAIYWDTTGTTGAYSVTATATLPGLALPTVPGDGSKSTAVNALVLPFVLTGGSLATSTSMDWVRIKTGAADAGKTLLAQSVGDPLTDIALTIYDSTGTAILDQEDTGGNVSAKATVAASTVYFVSYAAGAKFDTSHNTYEGVIRLQ
jgi:hypothetical protein